MSFLTCITGFFMNFELLPILTDYANRKGGIKFKKNSSPLKLLSQSQPNFAEMILGWSPSKVVSDISDIRPRWPPQPNSILEGGQSLVAIGPVVSEENIFM
jgi:hypothetical protein